MKKVFLIFISCLWTLFAIAQIDSSHSRSHPDSIIRYQYKHRMDTLYFREDAIKYAYAYNGGHIISIGYNTAHLGYLADLPVPTNRIGPTISLGGLYKNNDLYVMSSLSFSGHFYILYGNMDVNYFSNFSNSSFFIAPEIGISLVGRIYLGYSRQFALFNNHKIQLKNQINIGYFSVLKKTNRLYYVNGKRAKYLDRR